MCTTLCNLLRTQIINLWSVRFLGTFDPETLAMLERGSHFRFDVSMKGLLVFFETAVLIVRGDMLSTEGGLYYGP